MIRLILLALSITNAIICIYYAGVTNTKIKVRNATIVVIKDVLDHPEAFSDDYRMAILLYTKLINHALGDKDE